MQKTVKQHNANRADIYWGGYLLALFVVLIGFAGSFYLWSNRRHNEEEQVRASFRMESHNVISMIQRELIQYFEVLDSVGHLHSLSPDVNAVTFNEFVQKGMLYQQRILGVFGLAPSIDGRERKPYETAMRMQRRPDYSILEMRDEHWVPAAQRSVYFPVSYIAPDAFQDLPVGYDLHSDAGNAKAMLDAVKQGAVQAGGSIRGRRGVGRLILSPIKSLISDPGHNREGENYAYGYAFSVMYPSEVMERILRTYTPDGIDVEINESNNGNVTRLYPLHAQKQALNPSLHDEERLSMNGLNWIVSCEATSEFVKKHKTLMPWIYLIGGVLLSGVVAGQIAQLAGRNGRIRRLVSERTRELEQANCDLEHEIRKRHELQRQIIDISTQEKKRVGQDLHDSLGQQLTGIGLLTSALAKRLDQSQQEDVASQARQIAELLKDARATTRRMAHGLTPVELDVEALPEALEKLSREVQESSGINCAFEWWGKLDGINNDQAVNLYHIAQEALNNAIRHAGAENIRMELGSLLLKITDDGHGMNVDDVLRNGRGLGLKIMRYRAETAAGRLDIQSETGKGTTIVCTLRDTTAIHEQTMDGET